MGAGLGKQLPSSCHADMDVPSSVLDLPVALLVQVIWRLDTASRLSLFCTCRGFKDIVLDSAENTSLCLQPMVLDSAQSTSLYRTPMRQMLTALQLIHQHAKAVTVCMHGWKRQDSNMLQGGEAWCRHARQLAEHSCSLLRQAQRKGYLQNVTCLELADAELHTPLMPVFSDSCPNLTALTIQDSNITWEGVTADRCSAALPKLQTLHLRNVTGRRPSEAEQSGLQQQMSQLSGLKSLQLLQGGSHQHLYGAISEALTSTKAGQLTQLALPCRPLACQWKFSELMNLRDLQLQESMLDDDLMQQLLPLPNLTSVSIDAIHFSQSYRGHACHWQELVARHMTLQAFARLPLHSNLQIKGIPNGTLIVSAPGPNVRLHIQEAIDNITTSKWGGWRGAHVSLMAGKAQTLPLYHGVGRLVLCNVDLDGAGMVVLANFAVAQQHGFVLDLSRNCTWAVADLTWVIACLPAGSSLVVSRIHEATVIHLCSAAQCNIALHVKQMKHLHADAKEHVNAALLRRGFHKFDVYEVQVMGNNDDLRLCWDWVVILKSGHGAGAGTPVPHRDSLIWATSLRALKF